MLRQNQIAPTIPLSSIYNVFVLGEDEYAINGKNFYTNKGYLKKMGFSESSVALPYAHVECGKADLVRLSSLALFSPSAALLKEKGRDKK